MGYAFERRYTSGVVRYTAVYRDLKGRLCSAGTFDTRKQAEEAALYAERDAAEGRMPDRRRGRQTLRRYITEAWFPNHMIEATTREGYSYLINKYILPELGDMKLIELLPADVREWIGRLQDVYQLNPPTIRQCKTILDAALTTALSDRIVFLHAGTGVKTPPVVRKTKRIITVQQFEAIYAALDDPTMRLLVETDIETGLRWGELTELRPKDIDLNTGVITVSRTVVYLRAKDRPEGAEFVVKYYPKDREWRRVRLAPHMISKIREHITGRDVGPEDLIFQMPHDIQPRRRRRPAVLPDPTSLGLTEPNSQGRRYSHGTKSAYTAGRCRCEHCRNAMAAYRAGRRAQGHDHPRKRRTVNTDGHIGNDYFRRNVWVNALATAEIGFRITPHGLRHAHASWLLAGGADLQVVRERLGHGSITTTEQYLHALPGADDVALSALDTVRGRRAATGDPGVAPAAVNADDLAQLRAMVSRLSDALGGLGG
jgi:integrase